VDSSLISVQKNRNSFYIKILTVVAHDMAE
jgi:hypothetical protein